MQSVILVLKSSLISDWWTNNSMLYGISDWSDLISKIISPDEDYCYLPSLIEFL